MPRVMLTEEEAQLVQDFRRKTEIDRTHNAALDLAWKLVCTAVDTVLKDDTVMNPASRSIFGTMVLESLHEHKRFIK